MNTLSTPPVWRHRAAATQRAAEILAVVAWHVLSWAASHGLIWRDAASRGLEVRVAALLESLGPTFIKAGQVLSARPDLISPRLAAALARLRERVRPVPARDVEEAVETAFGRPVRDLFLHWDPQPVATGSVAQVHRAVLRDGRVVAVKVRRPGVARRVHGDFALARAMAGVFEWLPGSGAVPFRELVEEIARPVCEQLDFRLEAENNRRLRRIFEHADRLRIPELIPALCRDAVLTMEFVPGLQPITSAPLSSIERQDAAIIGLRALYRMIFTEGFVHADMHPGNLFVRAWGELVLLDTGLVARLSPADREAFVDFFFGLVNARGRDCARILVEGAARLGPRFDPQAFEAAICDLVDRHARRRSFEFEIAAFVGELIAIQRRCDVRGSTAFMTTVLAMVVFDGICKQLHPSCDFQKEARAFLVVARYRARGAVGAAAIA